MRIDIGQLEFIDQQLRDILVTLETNTGWEFTITSIYRINDSGVHGTLPVRGVDLRMREESLGKQIRDYINSKWEYNLGSGKQCALIHGDGYNMHLHIQVHPNTTII